MGTFETAKFAYMVPTLKGVVPEDKPESSTMRIHKVATGKVAEFKAEWDRAGWVWMPIYGIHALEKWGDKS